MNLPCYWVNFTCFSLSIVLWGLDRLVSPDQNPRWYQRVGRVMGRSKPRATGPDTQFHEVPLTNSAIFWKMPASHFYENQNCKWNREREVESDYWSSWNTDLPSCTKHEVSSKARQLTPTWLRRIRFQILIPSFLTYGLFLSDAVTRTSRVFLISPCSSLI